MPAPAPVVAERTAEEQTFRLRDLLGAGRFLRLPGGVPRGPPAPPRTTSCTTDTTHTACTAHTPPAPPSRTPGEHHRA
ncbi:hypothetical protein STXM2123_2997 [Streptomyces sp. F-3]|nr:hypothetical protein STXM2123_2997 [Streptomyces sp. F-3]